MKRSYLMALAAGLALAGWIASGQLDAGREPAGTTGAAAGDGPGNGAANGGRAPVTVRVEELVALPVAREVVVNGQNAPSRSVELRAEAAARVVEVLVEKGSRVREVDVVLRLDPRDRVPLLAQAEATLAQREMEYEAARRLGQRGYQAETQVAAARAQLEVARASLARARTELDQTEIVAPFGGVLERRPVEIGDFLEIGNPVATLLETDPFLVVGDLAESRIAGIALGMRGEAVLVDGQRVEGRVRYIASEADPQTRTFRVELEVPNPQGRVAAGMRARLRLLLPSLPAHRVPASLLALDDTGELGIKSVDEEDVVRFHPAQIVKSDFEAVWLAGLPERVRVITVGQGFVKDGQTVQPVAAPVAGEGA
jgi:membrane fusion protein, multidrug efflux system